MDVEESAKRKKSKEKESEEFGSPKVSAQGKVQVKESEG